MVWMCDAINVVWDVLDPKEPCVGKSWHNLLVVKGKFKTHPWTIQWEPMSLNGLADAAAKFSLLSLVTLYLDEVFVRDMPHPVLLALLYENDYL